MNSNSFRTSPLYNQFSIFMIEPRQNTEAFGLLARDLTAEGNGFRFCARGRSMWPTIQDGDILHVEPIRKSPRIGDIVLFMQECQFKAHRIIGGADNNFVTRGDAGMEIDGVVRREEILGRIVSKQSAKNCSPHRFNGLRGRLYFFETKLRSHFCRAMHVSLGSLAIATLLVFAPLALWGQGGVALDGTAQVGKGTVNCASSCSMSFTTPSITITSGLSNSVLFVGISIWKNGNTTVSVTSLTFNGQALTQAFAPAEVGTNTHAEIWYLVNPPAGAAFTINSTISKSNNNSIGVVIGAVSLYNVNTTAPVSHFNNTAGNNSGTTASVTVTSQACDGVFGVLDMSGANSVTTVGAGETKLWGDKTGTGASDAYGFGAVKGGDASVTLSETTTAGSWSYAAADIAVASSSPCLITAAKVNSLAANSTASGALITWKSGAEVHDLGYDLYRDVGGVKTKLNSSLIAGSALLMREALPQHGAKSYGWIDPAPVPGAVYWLEDVDLNGTRTMHGPVSVEPATAATTPVRSPSIGSLARARAQVANNLTSQPNSASHVLERTVRPGAITSSAQSIGFQLAAKPGIKILVDHEGWYRVTQPQLVAAGLRPNASSSLLHLFAEGVEQPIRVTGGGGMFGPQSAIEFYGTAIDTPYSGQRVYWLTEQGGAGLRIAKISAGGTATPPPSSFTQTLELKPKATYFAALLRDDTDNFFGPLVSPTPDVETINVADLAAGEAKLTVSLQGVTTGQQHDVTVMLNGSTLGDVTFADQQVGSAEFAVPSDILSNGANSVTLTAQQGTNDISLVDAITLRFAHTYTAESNLLKFTAGAGQSIAISGFTQPPSRLVDITNALRPLEIRFASSTQNGLYTLESTVPWTTAGEHTLLALSDQQLGTPVSMISHAPTTLHAPQPGAEFLVITAPQFNAQFQPLASLHRSSGNSAAVINVSDIYDEFNFGEPSPFAVKTFLKTATTAWTAKPHYLVLGGDASVDPRNYLGLGFFDFVPTKIISTSQLKTASDDWFSDFNNSGFATIATGRMAARTPSDAQLMVSKTAAYSTGTTGSWNSQALLVADADDPGISFAQAAQSVQGLLPSTLNPTDVFAGNLGTSTANQDILAGINSGQLLVNYNGHGSVQVWGSGGLFDDTMAASLTNGSKLPFFVIMNCLNGFFHDVYTQSLAESLMLAPNGGAVAVWASSGLTNAGPQFQMNDRLMQTLFSQPAPALGDAVLTAKSGILDLDVRRTFIFFGDPALRLRTPGSSGETWRSSRLQTTISTDEKSER